MPNRNQLMIAIGEGYVDMARVIRAPPPGWSCPRLGPASRLPCLAVTAVAAAQNAALVATGSLMLPLMLLVATVATVATIAGVATVAGIASTIPPLPASYILHHTTHRSLFVSAVGATIAGISSGLSNFVLQAPLCRLDSYAAKLQGERGG
ncbi:hypothetical protein LEL_08743 [Akanthomyces lecanii RCEF 1005]|uniref:Uncharacterized protein n=1 Tax=Akanthomyces lecanii RCEF 1005 TaxID=1081108 RepID=A0A162MZ89_CORDF|nr:hypothetical protein LEL_08743 [Akanthomyces lecanii RCEF 1005]